MKKRDLRAERKEHRLQENKKSILKASEKIITNKGYTLATMDDIGREAQFSKATIYRYFRSKREIFIKIILRSLEEVHESLSEILTKKISSEEKLRKTIYYITSYYSRKRNIARIFFIESSTMKKILNISQEQQLQTLHGHPAIPNEFMVMMKKISDITYEIIKEGIESGEFREVNVTDASFILGSMLRGFLLRGPMKTKEYSLNEGTDLLMSFLLYGIKKERKGA